MSDARSKSRDRKNFSISDAKNSDSHHFFSKNSDCHAKNSDSHHFFSKNSDCHYFFFRVIAFITLWAFLFTNIGGEFLIERAWARTQEPSQSYNNKTGEGRFSLPDLMKEVVLEAPGVGYANSKKTTPSPAPS